MNGIVSGKTVDELSAIEAEIIDFDITWSVTVLSRYLTAGVALAFDGQPYICIPLTGIKLYCNNEKLIAKSLTGANVLYSYSPSSSSAIPAFNIQVSLDIDYSESIRREDANIRAIGQYLKINHSYGHYHVSDGNLLSTASVPATYLSF